MNKKQSKWELFLTFLKIGAFTFGGGYAMIALLEGEFVTKKKWIEKDEFLDMVAIAESTPGPIAINSATYIGYKTAGVLGSALATLGVVLPSLCIIYAISLFLDAFLGLRYVGYAFKGIQACVCYLILSAGLRMMKGLQKSLWNYLILGLTAAALLCISIFDLGVSSIFLILAAGAAGLAAFAIRRIRGKEEAK